MAKKTTDAREAQCPHLAFLEQNSRGEDVFGCGLIQALQHAAAPPHMIAACCLDACTIPSGGSPAQDSFVQRHVRAAYRAYVHRGKRIPNVFEPGYDFEKAVGDAVPVLGAPEVRFRLEEAIVDDILEPDEAQRLKDQHVPVA